MKIALIGIIVARFYCLVKKNTIFRIRCHKPETCLVSDVPFAYFSPRFFYAYPPLSVRNALGSRSPYFAYEQAYFRASFFNRAAMSFLSTAGFTDKTFSP